MTKAEILESLDVDALLKQQDTDKQEQEILETERITAEDLAITICL